MPTHKADETVDLVAEFVDLYSREEMLAFFEFRLGGSNGHPVEGLCRISQPKDGRSNLYYLSLGFVVDTPDEASRKRVDDSLAKLDGDALRSTLPCVIEVLPVTVMSTEAESQVRQADILLDEDTVGEASTFLPQLVPAIAAIMGLDAGELVWWTATA